MADTERMEAVKRAYAEIILNTAAESAGRILAAERKALGLQRSLASTKQEAVDMMVRLKSLMDSKINEAETRTTLHARRIQELELQLQNAECVILSLQAELEREREANRKPPQQAAPAIDEEEEENTSSYYKNVVSTDDSCCSVKHVLRTGTSIVSNQGSKVRSRNRWTQRVRAFDQSKEPKGSQIHVKNAKSKKSRENGGERKVLFKKDPPRRSRTKNNYAKISKFGMKTDSVATQNGSNVLGKCIEKEKETLCNLDSGTDEALLGLELIADNIEKEDENQPALEPTIKRTETETKPDATEKPNLNPVTEGSSRSIKYTFSRKRKRGLSLSSENNNNGIILTVVPVLEDNNNKDGYKKERDCLEVAESEEAQRLKLHQSDGAASDSTRGNRRVVQVARQLISLSTKKW